MGYIRFPTIHADTIVFGYEDDLWSVPTTGGTAVRLTAGVAEARHPAYSPDGAWIAYTGGEEGPSEVFVLPADGGDATRLTFGAVDANVLGWSPDSRRVLFSSSASSPVLKETWIHEVPVDGGPMTRLPYGMATSFAYGPDGAMVLGRFARREPAHWKRYRGGEAGALWVDESGDGEFRELPRLAGNVVSPCWVGGNDAVDARARIFFLSDHEGIGNVYSVLPDGSDLTRHTDHEEFYARNLRTDGARLVYHRAGELWLLDPSEVSEGSEQGPRRVEVRFPNARTQRARRFVAPEENLDSWSLGPDGSGLALTTRGKAFSFGNWEGPVTQHGQRDGARYRLLRWLPDRRRLIAGVADEHPEERLVVLTADGSEPPLPLDAGAGRALELEPAPGTRSATATGAAGTTELVALINHRSEIGVVDLAADRPEFRVLDRGEPDQLRDLTWSPDGRWLAYAKPLSPHRSAIMLCDVVSGTVVPATDPVLTDHSPCFEPTGRYLYFLGSRELDPVPDDVQFDYGFPATDRPFLVLLRADDESPFVPRPKPLASPSGAGGESSDGKDGQSKDGQSKEGESKDGADDEDGAGDTTDGDGAGGATTPIRIDLEGITERVVSVGLPAARYHRIAGVRGKLLLLSRPFEGALSADIFDPSGKPDGVLDAFDLEKRQPERILDGVEDFALNPAADTLVYRSGRRLRVLRAGEKPTEDGDTPSRGTGWVDLDRVKVSVRPGSEWRQMFTEAWRMQRDHFWSAEMSGVDWDAMYRRYLPLVEKVSTRSELSDLIWEFQGELGTSHAYEIGGAYRGRPHYRQGFLGADWEFDAAIGRYRVGDVIRGDRWDPDATSPLNRPGVDVRPGDVVLAINGQPVGDGVAADGGHVPPGEPLVSQAGEEVQVTVRRGEEESRTVAVRAIADERAGRYRDWVERNRAYVAQRTDGRVGYIHIPNMVGSGFSEFHRAFLAEYDREALLLDVRFNSGGSVSSLLLQKLARRRMGYDFSRWFSPRPFPEDSPRGPMVAVTNQLAGSDGDIFSHAFKMMGLGTLVGKRTWGGVIGIWPRHQLADGTITTQPEFSFAFDDVGWGLENHGAEPDVEVETRPQDYAKGVDPQLDKGIELALADIESRPPHAPRRPS